MDPKYKDLSVKKQCELLEISRTAFYYTPDTTSDDRDFTDLQLILDVLRKIPFYGYRKISRQLLPEHLIVKKAVAAMHVKISRIEMIING